MFSRKEPRTFELRRPSDVSNNETDKMNTRIYIRNYRNRRGFSLIWLLSLVVIFGFLFYFFDTLFS